MQRVLIPLDRRPLAQVDYTQRICEYACHEGKLAMRNILSGAWAAEGAAR